MSTDANLLNLERMITILRYCKFWETLRIGFLPKTITKEF